MKKKIKPVINKASSFVVPLFNQPKKHLKTWLVIFLALTAALAAFFFLLSPRATEAAWWDETWLYRKAVQISNANSEDLTDFQVAIILDTASLITAGKMQGDCDDLRITDDDGNVIPHWLEENNPGCNNVATKVWVKVPTVHKGTNATTVYAYYGNSQAENAENGDNVFEFFDDFEDGSYMDKWTVLSGTWVESGGTITQNNNSHKALKSIQGTLTNNLVIESRAKTTSNNRFCVGAKSASVNADGLQNVIYVAAHGVANSPKSEIWDGTTQYSDTGNSDPNDNTFYILKEEIFGDTGIAYLFDSNGTQLSTASVTHASSTLGNKVQLQSFDSAVWDWIFVRKYVATDPTTSLNTEETSPGLVAYWKFDEGTGTTAHDSSGQGYHGAITGATWQTEEMCVSGKCLNFDGSNDYVDTTSLSISPGDTVTIEFWIKQTEATGQNIGVMVGNSYGFGIDGDANDRVWILKSGVGNYYGTPGKIGDSEWHFLTAVVNSSNTTFYVDGKQDGIVAQGHGGGTVLIGKRDNNSQFLQGFLDEVKIYNYARSAKDIKADYAAGLAGIGSAKGSSVIMGSSGLASALNDGLVGYWKMDEASWVNDCSTATVLDSSGNNNHGKSCPNAAGTQPAGGKFGNGGSFDGSNDYVNIGNQSSLNFGSQSFTVSFWTKNPISGRAIAKMNWTGTGDPNDEAGWYVSAISSGLDWGIGDGTNLWLKPTYPYTFNSNQWYLVTGVFNKETGYFYGYINNDLIGSNDISAYGSVTNNKSFMIGRRDCSAPTYFNGLIDEVRIYNRALSPAEVKALYEWASGPVGYWKLDEGAGSAAADSSGYGRSGAVVNGLWAPGKFGGGLKFDGSGDYLEITDF